MLSVARSRFAVKVLGDQSALKKAIAGSDKTRVVAWFTASWCGPCKAVTPHIEKLSESVKNVNFLKIDIDDNQELAEYHVVGSVPTFIMFTDKERVVRLL